MKSDEVFDAIENQTVKFEMGGVHSKNTIDVVKIPFPIFRRCKRPKIRRTGETRKGLNLMG